MLDPILKFGIRQLNYLKKRDQIKNVIENNYCLL